MENMKNMKNYHKEIISISDNMEEYGYSLISNMVKLVDEVKFNEWVEIWLVDTESDFDEAFYNAHKALRQTDPFMNPNLEMLFWNHIQISNKIEKLLKGILKE